MKAPHPIAVGSWLVLILAAAALEYYGRTLQRIERANELYWDGNTAASIAAFAELEDEFRGGLRSRLLPGADRDRVAQNHLQLLYVEQSYDRVIEESEAYLLDHVGPAPWVRFWLGNAYYRKALADDGSGGEDRALAWLRRAAAQYQQAVIDSPVEWDVKHNHELIQSLLRRDNEDQKQDIFEVLRPREKPDPQPPSRPVG
jgi:hypothetical protein